MNVKDIKQASDIAEKLAVALSDLVEIERRDNLADPCMVATDKHRKETWESAREALAAYEKGRG